MFFLAALGLLGAGAGAAAGSAVVGGTAAALTGATLGAGVGLGVAGAIQQHRAYTDRRMREAALGEARKDGEKKRAALDTAARKVYNRSRSRSLFRPSGDFAGLLDGDDTAVPVFGV
jgi:hypothetical protein